jgi:cytidylate kinase
MSMVIEALKKYLARKEDLDEPAGNQPFVTLTRLDGATSHEVARAIVARLDDLPDKGWNRGWELLDLQLCAWLIKEGRVPATMEELVAEHYGEGKLHQMFYEMLVGEPEQQELCRKVGDVTRFLLKTGRTVVVGSAAAPEAASLKGPGVRIRLVASEPFRVARIVAAQSVTPEAARKSLHAQDLERARLLREHYRREIDDITLYDASFLADRQSPREIARIVVEMLHIRVDAQAKRAPLSATQVISLA